LFGVYFGCEGSGEEDVVEFGSRVSIVGLVISIEVDVIEIRFRLSEEAK
jgi:hypothetical protein